MNTGGSSAQASTGGDIGARSELSSPAAVGSPGNKGYGAGPVSPPLFVRPFRSVKVADATSGKFLMLRGTSVYAGLLPAGLQEQRLRS